MRDSNDHILKDLRELQKLILERDKLAVEEAKKFLEERMKNKQELIQIWGEFLPA